MSKKKPKKDSDLVNILLSKPKKDIHKPYYPWFDKDHTHQMDLLFLPHDGNYKYALVVVDVGTRVMDAEALASKESSAVLKGLQTIYKRKILSKPMIMSVDDGNEFKGDVKKWLMNNDIMLKVAKPQRHRQVAVVEAKNKVIGKKLFKRMIQQELLTGVQSNAWVEDLPNVVKELNVIAKSKKIKQQETDYSCIGNDCKLLNEGDKVRKAFDAPRDVISGKRLPGTFRETDIRWTIEPHTISKVSFIPGQPPLYSLDNDDTTMYTKNQLMPFKGEIVQKQGSEVIRPVDKIGKHDVYVVESIVAKRKFRNKFEYLVKWKGYSSDDNTWENAAKMKEDIPELVKEFEKNKVTLKKNT